MFQQKTDAHSLDLSSLTLKEPPSPVEELVTNISSAKVSFKNAFQTISDHLTVLKLQPLHSSVVLSQPVLQYASAFDDEVEELTEDVAAELPDVSGAPLECVPEEEACEAGPDTAPEPQPDEQSPANQAESAHPSTNVVHGPYYYFYQGV